MHASPARHNLSNLFGAIFILVTVLVLVAVGYAAWIVVRYWDRVGV